MQRCNDPTFGTSLKPSNQSRNVASLFVSLVPFLEKVQLSLLNYLLFLTLVRGPFLMGQLILQSLFLIASVPSIPLVSFSIKLWNSLRLFRIHLTYDLNDFKSLVNKHLASYLQRNQLFRIPFFFVTSNPVVVTQPCNQPGLILQAN